MRSPRTRARVRRTLDLASKEPTVAHRDITDPDDAPDHHPALADQYLAARLAWPAWVGLAIVVIAVMVLAAAAAGVWS